MIFRRIAALAVVGVLPLAPLPGRALGEEQTEIAKTGCTAGSETLTYDRVNLDWIASATIYCPEPKNQLALSVSAVLLQAQRNSVAIAESGIFCLSCPALQHRAYRGGPTMTDGIYQVATTAGVSIEGKPWQFLKRYSCFLVRNGEAKPLLADCPKVN